MQQKVCTGVEKSAAKCMYSGIRHVQLWKKCSERYVVVEKVQ